MWLSSQEGQSYQRFVPASTRDDVAVVLLAMGAYFSGVVQSPITAAVIVIEMTAARFMTLPLLVATVLAYQASQLVCPVPLYESLARSFLRRVETERG